METQHFSQDIAAYDGSTFIGYMDVDDVRPYISRREATVRGQGKSRRVVFISAVAAKAKALCNSSTRAALSTTQQEELYQGLRRPGHGQTPTDLPMSVNPITVVRKYRAGIGFLNWGEKEKFARRRWNEDKIPPAIYQSEAHYRAAQATRA